MSDTSWFLYCENAHSNEVVSSALRGLQADSDFKEYECADGKLRYLYQVPDYTFASTLYKSQQQLCAKLKIFRAHKNQKPEEWKFVKTKKPTTEALIQKSNKLKAGKVGTKRRGQKSALRF